ncbi:MAG: hypothetical protein ACI8S6_000201 [Myxococcota bacterium]
MEGDHWQKLSQKLQQHGLVVEASMSGLRAWIPRTVTLIELATHAWLLGIVVMVATRHLRLGELVGAVGLLLAAAGTVGILGLGLLHLLVVGSRGLRKRLGQEVIISMHSVTARGRTLPLEEITGFTLIRRIFLARWLYARTRDGRWVLLAHNDDEMMMVHLRHLLEERRQARVAQLSEAGHDLEESVRPPPALEALRGGDLR